jgi:hypothetical protein
LYAATCRHCGRAIVQHPSGVWIPRDGSLKSDPKGFYCQGSAGGRGPRMLHEPMPAELPGAPRWLSPDTAQVRADTVAPAQGANRPRLPREAVAMRVRHFLVRIKEMMRFRMAWW